MVVRGLLRRCAVCGEGHLYRRYFALADRCPRCGFRFERREGQLVGAVGVNTIVTFGLVLIVVVIGSVLTAPDVAVGPLITIAVAVAIVVPVLFYPISKTLWCAIDLGFDPLEPGEAPGLELVGGDHGARSAGPVERS
jgi:uncharacterized protein (DUF983 family)